MRIPLEGGPAETILPDVGVQGEYNCSTRPAGRCVFRTIQNRAIRILGFASRARQRTRTREKRLGPAECWGLGHLAGRIPGRHSQSRSARCQGSGGPARCARRNGERTVTIEGLRNLSGVVWAADGKRMVRFGQRLDARAPFLCRSRRTNPDEPDGVDAPSYAVPSPDGRHVAYMDWTVNANVWHVRGL